MSVGWGFSRDCEAHFPLILGGKWGRQERTLRSKSWSSNVRQKTEMKPIVPDNGFSLIISFIFFFIIFHLSIFAFVFSFSALPFFITRAHPPEGHIPLRSNSAMWPMLFSTRTVLHNLHLIWRFKRITTKVFLWVCTHYTLGCSSSNGQLEIQYKMLKSNNSCRLKDSFSSPQKKQFTLIYFCTVWKQLPRGSKITFSFYFHSASVEWFQTSTALCYT